MSALNLHGVRENSSRVFAVPKGKDGIKSTDFLECTTNQYEKKYHQRCLGLMAVVCGTLLLGKPNDSLGFRYEGASMHGLRDKYLHDIPDTSPTFSSRSPAVSMLSQ